MTTRVRASILALAFAVIVTMPAIAAAQSPVSIGVKGGVNIAKVKTDDPNDDEDVKSLVGGVAGLFLSKAINDSVGFRLETLFSQKGAKDAESGEDAKFKLTYFDVPVLLTFGPSSSGDTHFNLFTGPQFSFNTAAKFVEEGVPDTDIKDSIKSTDFGWVLGAGLEKGRVTADVRYTLGLSDITETADKVKNRVFSVMIGVKLNK